MSTVDVASRPIKMQSERASNALSLGLVTSYLALIVGLLAAYVFYDEGYTAFNKPAVFFNIAWYLQHRFRTGADVSRAMPYLALGFAFQSDLLDGG